MWFWPKVFYSCVILLLLNTLEVIIRDIKDLEFSESVNLTPPPLSFYFNKIQPFSQGCDSKVL